MFMTFGSGHDLMCNNAGPCYTTPETDYSTGFKWQSRESGSYISGTQIWNAKTGGDQIEVYMVDYPTPKPTLLANNSVTTGNMTLDLSADYA